MSLLGTVPFERVLLGSAVEIGLGDVGVVVVLPGPRVGNDGFLEPQPDWLFPQAAEQFAGWSPLVDKQDPMWGGSANPNLPVVWIKRVQLRLRTTSLEPPLPGGSFPVAPPGILQQLAGWRANLLLWVEVFSRHACRYQSPPGHLNSIPFWSESGPVPGPGFNNRISTRLVEVEPIGETLWKSLAQVALAEPPPISWQLVADARAFLAAGDFRRSVIDAAVAVDVALSRELERRFAAEAGRFDSLLARQVLSRGLHALVEASRISGLQFWDQKDMDVLKSARNKAAHAGESLSRGEAETSVNLAQEVLSQLDPAASYLPTPAA